MSARQFSLSNTFPIVLRRCTPTASTGPLPAPCWPLQAGDFCLKPELDSVCPCFTPSRVPPLQLSSLLVPSPAVTSCRLFRVPCSQITLVFHFLAPTRVFRVSAEMILPQTGLPVTPDLSFIQLITFLIVLFICWLSFLSIWTISPMKAESVSICSPFFLRCLQRVLAHGRHSLTSCRIE